MTNREKKKAIKDALKYLLTEGFVVKIGNKYRLKTKKELNSDLKCV